jgi:tRNA(His) 5'-end guanylyltransferase
MNNVDKDALGNRMKENYENRTRYCLPRRTYTILRLDGCHFHTYTRGLRKPFDKGLYEDIDNAIIAILSELQGAVLAYTQSDEISLLLTDFSQPSTDAWFDGNLQKMVSVSASVMTAHFNKFRWARMIDSVGLKNELDDPCFTIDRANFETYASEKIAYFDSRAFTIPDRVEVMNYFRWRQQDCIRNSVSMVAQANFSHKELNGKSQSDMHEMLHRKGINWATDFTDGQKNGRIITKETYKVDVPEMWQKLHEGQALEQIQTERTRWASKDAWVFTKDEGKLLNTIPKYAND